MSPEKGVAATGGGTRSGVSRDGSAILPAVSAAEALAAVLTAETSLAQLKAYAHLEQHLSDRRAAVYDAVCNQVSPVGAWFSRCMRRHDRRATHTVDNQRWATTNDLALASRWPLIDKCWDGGKP